MAGEGPAPTVDVSIVTPARNEAPSLEELGRQFDAVAREIPERRFEWIVVDDGSTDGSWSVIEGLDLDAVEVRAVRLRRGFGKAAALAVGTDEARGDLVVMLDADLQDDPADIPALLAAVDGGLDLASGWKQDRQDSRRRRVASRVFNRTCSTITGVAMHDSNCGFKAGRTEVFRQLPLYGELHRFIPILAHDLGYQVGEVPVHNRRRIHGTSRYKSSRYLRAFLDLLTVLVLSRYGRRPGHLFGSIGVALGATGFAILAYLTAVWTFTDHAIGQRPLLTLGVLLVLSGLQLLSIGILSELLLHRTAPRPGSELVAARR